MELLLFNYFFIFPCRLHFSGIHGNSSQFIDISDVRYHEKSFVRDVFVRSGFAVKIGEDPDKLGPCPLGTFVDSSRTHPICKYCPAGKL